MEYNTTTIDYQVLCESLKYSIKDRLGEKFSDLYINDYNSDNYDISLCLVLNVNKTEVMDTYLETLDDIVDMEFKYDIIISIVPTTIMEATTEGEHL